MKEFAGTLRERIELWERVPVRLPTGASSDDMRKILSCLACVVVDGVAANDEAMSVSAMERFKVTIRTDRRVAVDQQVRWRGRHLLIRQLVADPVTPDRMVLRCEERRS